MPTTPPSMTRSLCSILRASDLKLTHPSFESHPAKRRYDTSCMLCIMAQQGLLKKLG